MKKVCSLIDINSCEWSKKKLRPIHQKLNWRLDIPALLWNTPAIIITPFYLFVLFASRFVSLFGWNCKTDLWRMRSSLYTLRLSENKCDDYISTFIEGRGAFTLQYLSPRYSLRCFLHRFFHPRTVPPLPLQRKLARSLQLGHVTRLRKDRRKALRSNAMPLSCRCQRWSTSPPPTFPGNCNANFTTKKKNPRCGFVFVFFPLAAL